MQVILDHDRAVLFAGDCADLDMPENSVDALVFDPPAGIAFMGKKWDEDRGGRDAWSEWLAGRLAPSFRALKPGGHCLAWALPRTSHWTARALEIAGFEIRDVHHDALAVDPMVEQFIASLDQTQRAALARVVEAGGAAAPIFYHLFGTGFPKSLTSASAEIPTGAGTALKPAVEHWILARKPLDGTVAECHARWGTGCLSIDACRITHPDGERGSWSDDPAPNGDRGFYMPGEIQKRSSQPGEKRAPGGRWPAHLSLDESAAAEIDAQSGATGSHGGDVDGDLGYKGGASGRTRTVVKSTGGASRFFYVAKAPRTEKDAGIDHLEKKSGGEATGREDGSAGTKNPRAGAGRTGGARNVHPTVKSVALMRWLVRLVTPPGGVVLDPFAGSGSTGVAALAEEMIFVGCEQGGETGEYLPILLGRVRHALGLPSE